MSKRKPEGQLTIEFRDIDPENSGTWKEIGRLRVEGGILDPEGNMFRFEDEKGKMVCGPETNILTAPTRSKN